MVQQTVPSARTDVPAVTHVGFILEVAADNPRDLGDKLYGYDDLEAERVAMGYDAHDDAIDYDYLMEEASYEESVSMEEVEAVQTEQETVNALLTDAVFNGHPVLFKTDGTNLADVTASDDYTEIPHFSHGASDCADVDACRAHPDSGGVYRMFPEADLILAGAADMDGVHGAYQLRDDVLVTITSVRSNPTPGKTDAEQVDGSSFDLS